MTKNSKVFGIGFAKTGTTTLGKCLEILGFKHIGKKLDLVYAYKNKDFKRLFDVIDKHESFEDWPWSLIYKEVDQHYPFSKFILTVRDIENVVRSYKNMVANEVPRKDIKQIRKIIYGFESIEGHEREFIKRYENHTEDVKEYFRGREKDLLIVNWEKGDGWIQLCNFLNKEIPNVPFPHCNRGVYNKSIYLQFKKCAKKLIKLLKPKEMTHLMM
jgi:hypothetical protein